MEGKMRRKNKRAENGYYTSKPSPSELEIVKFLYENVTSYDGKISGYQVSYFFGREAVDILMNSKWAKLQLKSKDPKQIHFLTEDSIIKFMDKMLQKNLFSKAIKVKRKCLTKKKDDEKKKNKSKKVPDTKYKQESIEAGDIDKKISKEDSLSKSTSKVKKTTSSQSATDSWYSSLFSPSVTPVTKSMARLEHCQEQVFTCSSNGQHQTGATADEEEIVYVWIYEPPPGLKVWLMGFALILAIIGCCFFPIWPASLRLGAYYLTMAVLSFLGLLICLALLRLSIYVLVFTGSVGRVHWWLFPNLFADCGFFESFRPLYSLERASLQKKEKRATESSGSGDGRGDSSSNEKSKKLD